MKAHTVVLNTFINLLYFVSMLTFYNKYGDACGYAYCSSVLSMANTVITALSSTCTFKLIRLQLSCTLNIHKCVKYH
jgi:hypothetical protein